jgi:hypothetical protein
MDERNAFISSVNNQCANGVQMLPVAVVSAPL